MDFAKKILSKYGWKEGEGLGKNNSGIAAPLKASLKFDNAGLGVDRATEFNDHWWERCFNEAASNVTVQVEHNGKVSTARKAGEDAVEISTKGYSARKLQKAKDQQRDAEGGAVYEHFLKSALLTQDGGEVADTERIKAEDIAVTKVHVMTDEELFKACGGRTAHKGARHGLKLSGKLARLEQQEREMLAKLQTKLQNETTEAEAESKKKKRKKELIEGQLQTENLSLEVTVTEEAEPTESKKKKRKKEIGVSTEEAEDLSHSVAEEAESHKKDDDVKDGASVEPTASKKKKRKKKPESTEDAEDVGLPVADEVESPTPVKSKKAKKEEAVLEETSVPVKPKKKKRKHKEDE